MDEGKRLLREKKQVFEDFHVPWDYEIEQKFKREMSKFPNKDPSIVLDRISHDYLFNGI